MPYIGELTSAKSIGIKTNHNYRWQSCPDCGKERWVRSNESTAYLCKDCAQKYAAETRSKVTRPIGLAFKHARDLGKSGQCYYFLSCCPVCGKQMWRQKQDMGRYCRNCSRRIKQSKRMSQERNPRWTGGRSIDRLGYVHLTTPPTSPYYSMATKISHHILEHRLVMAKHLGRCLQSWEVVHHKNRNKSDNSIGNLELLPNASRHAPFTKMEQRISSLERRVFLLEAENELLRGQLEKARV